MARREQLKSDLVRYREHTPPPHLAGWVECLWTGEAGRPTFAAPVRPDGCIDLVYSRREGLRAVGAMTVTQRFDQAPDNFHCGVRFLPGMAGPFLGMPAGELTDLAAPLNSSNCRPIDDAETAAGAVRILAASLPHPPSSQTPIQRAIGALTRAKGLARLDRTASQANLSTRHFRRLCIGESGLTPKQLCRILRFRNALEISRCAAPDWSAIALAAGYFDQAHLIRDFREFAGETPMAVFSNRSAGAVA
ncbi:MAG: AraC family transcriptional regulator [Acidobacteriota bacterium]|nr:AraC family transcriptional regulator [Acidobacteriota bacterium]